MRTQVGCELGEKSFKHAADKGASCVKELFETGKNFDDKLPSFNKTIGFNYTT